LNFENARGVTDLVLRHGARPAPHALEERLGAESGKIAEFAVDRIDIGIVCAREKTPRNALSSGSAVWELGAQPSASDDPAPFLGGNQETEAGHGRGTIEREGYDDRRAVIDGRKQFG